MNTAYFLQENFMCSASVYLPLPGDAAVKDLVPVASVTSRQHSLRVINVSGQWSVHKQQFRGQVVNNIVHICMIIIFLNITFLMYCFI